MDRAWSQTDPGGNVVPPGVHRPLLVQIEWNVGEEFVAALAFRDQSLGGAFSSVVEGEKKV
jgi:hypothetical protein